MANEATPIELLGNNQGGEQISYTVADGAGIVKGTLLKFADPRTASATSAVADLFAGVAAMDKVADDGATTISVWQKGVFDMAASGTINAGSRVVVSTPANYVIASAANTDPAKIIGVALDNASSGRVSVRMNL